ncbi:MAG: hypothetical protein R3C03_00320 [Pirellulaceae bacterium]
MTTKTTRKNTRTKAPASKTKAPASKANNVFADAVMQALTATMMVDKDFMVTYQNQASVKLLTKYAALFRSIWPTFDPNAMIGLCIDQFHKDPSHQRRLLADKNNLPYTTDIRVKDVSFQLNVMGQFDAKVKSLVSGVG